MSIGFGLGLVLVTAAVTLVLPGRVLGVHDRLNSSWLDAWLKTAVIVVAVIFLTVVLPDWIVTSGTVAKMSRFAQDLLGVSFWLGGMAAVIWGLRYAHRESRV